MLWDIPIDYWLLIISLALHAIYRYLQIRILTQVGILFIHGYSDPTPDRYYYTGDIDEIDDHGTSCAGEIGMAKSNGDCGVGIAYECYLGGLKIVISKYQTH